MRLTSQNVSSIRNKRTIMLPRAEGRDGVTLTVYALPPTYPEDAEREIPSPRPQWKGEYARDRRGKIEQDKQGRPMKVYDEDDAKYQAELREAQQLQTVKMVVDALDPSEIQFEASRNGQEPKAYYAAVRRELAAFGFSVGDLAYLVRAVAEVSGIDQEAIRAARADFFEADSSPSGT